MKKQPMNFIENSIAKGETIKEDWETFDEREARLPEACERKKGGEFSPEDDYSIAERQAGDYDRALQPAAKRHRTTHNKH